MNYNNRRMNPDGFSRQHKGNDENFHELAKCLDEIATYLHSGAHWHLRAANCSRRIYIRGFGRWHDCEAKGDFCALEKLLKVVNDKIGYMPVVNMETVSKSENFSMDSLDAFVAHFDVWEKRESALIDCLNTAVHAARTIDIQIYKELMCLLEEVQDEVMRATMAKESMAFAGWNTHDISVKSMIIHKYFEEEHKPGGEININIG